MSHLTTSPASPASLLPALCWQRFDQVPKKLRSLGGCAAALEAGRHCRILELRFKQAMVKRRLHQYPRAKPCMDHKQGLAQAKKPHSQWAGQMKQLYTSGFIQLLPLATRAEKLDLWQI